MWRFIATWSAMPGMAFGETLQHGGKFQGVARASPPPLPPVVRASIPYSTIS
ncbi:hypothetical protein [Nitrosomonas sp. Nm34]|uniref:hypothetical protein n=1 Tax=Nitrosomonas sp. Nm34 TaxID=1881055 RepID=UPI001C316FE7|nr:hypothetical protein [Nitrosomonas sp. Nm34]